MLNINNFKIIEKFATRVELDNLPLLNSDFKRLKQELRKRVEEIRSFFNDSYSDQRFNVECKISKIKKISVNKSIIIGDSSLSGFIEFRNFCDTKFMAEKLNGIVIDTRQIVATPSKHSFVTFNLNNLNRFDVFQLHSWTLAYLNRTSEGNDQDSPNQQEEINKN